MTVQMIDDTPSELRDFRFFSRLAFASIAIVFGGFGTWSALAPLDSAAVASGRVSVEGDRKPIQHLEGGIIREVLVRDAQIVEEGDVLFKLQPTQAQSNTGTLKKQIDASMAMEARLVAESELAATIRFPETLEARRHLPETATAIRDQERQFAERKRSLDMQVAILKARVEQTGRESAGKETRLMTLQQQQASYAKEISSVTGLAERGYYPRNKLLALQREQSRVDGDLGQTVAEIAKLKEVLIETRLQIRQTEQKTIEDVSQQLSEVRARLSEAREKLAVAEDVLYRIEVRSPRRGIVLGVKVNGPGTVVAPGAILAEVVPISEKLQLSARVSPLDVQSVHVGQKATVRFPGLSTRQTPTIFGKVETLSADSVTDEATKETYFSAKIVIDRSSVAVDVAQLITPGMPADVLISTGERTALDYLIGPLRDISSKAMRER